MPKLKPTFSLPSSYKRLRCRVPVNYQCGGKCQPAKNKCKKLSSGVPKTALEWMKYIQERKERVEGINLRRAGGRSRLGIDDLGFVKRTGQSVDFNKREPRVSENVIPEVDLHLFLKPGDKVNMKDKFGTKRTDIIEKANKYSLELKKYNYQPTNTVQSVIRDGKTYTVEQSGEWTRYIDDELRKGTLDWDKFNLKSKFPVLHKLYGKRAKPGRLSTEKKEGEKIELIGTPDDMLGQFSVVTKTKKYDEGKFPSLLKKAQQWSRKPPTESQLKKQERRIELTKKILGTKQGLEKWLKKKAIEGESLSGSGYYRSHYRFPSVEKEEAILSAMMGDKGEKLKKIYPIYLQRMQDIADKAWAIHEQDLGAKTQERRQEIDEQLWELFGGTRPSRTNSVFGVNITGDHKKDLPLIKSAYRKAVRIAHPDAGGSDAKFRQVNEEWERYKKTLPSDFAEMLSLN